MMQIWVQRRVKQITYKMIYDDNAEDVAEEDAEDVAMDDLDGVEAC